MPHLSTGMLVLCTTNMVTVRALLSVNKLCELIINFSFDDSEHQHIYEEPD